MINQRSTGKRKRGEETNKGVKFKRDTHTHRKKKEKKAPHFVCGRAAEGDKKTKTEKKAVRFNISKKCPTKQE
jgi:hypothetical protein